MYVCLGYMYVITCLPFKVDQYARVECQILGILEYKFLKFLKI